MVVRGTIAPTPTATVSTTASTRARTIRSSTTARACAAAECPTSTTTPTAIADCVDVCPLDNTKTTSAGICGCGKSDTLDTDHDGTVDCLDACPKNAARTTAGPCGCVADATPLCLVHRYGFAGTGTTVTDSITIAGVSPANGTAMNVTLPNTGSIVLAGRHHRSVREPAGGHRLVAGQQRHLRGLGDLDWRRCVATHLRFRQQRRRRRRGAGHRLDVPVCDGAQLGHEHARGQRSPPAGSPARRW